MFKFSSSIPALIRVFCGALALSLVSSVALADDFDINGDGCVSVADSECLIQASLQFPSQPDCMDVSWSQADLNGDRSVDIFDVQLLSIDLTQNGSTCDCSAEPERTDLNGDCALDQADIDCYIQVVFWEMIDPSQPTPACMVVTLEDADYNYDGLHTVADLQILVDTIK